MKNNQGNTFLWVLLILGILAFLVFIFVIPFTGLHVNTGNGTHVGYVTAVEENGLIFKTGRAYIKSDVSSSQEDLYCIIDDEVATQLRTLAEKKAKVEVTYFSWFAYGIKNCAGESSVISSVKEIN